MKQIILTLTAFFLFSGNSNAHLDEQCKTYESTSKIVVDKLIEQEGESICQFKGFGMQRWSGGLQEINCSKIVMVCDGDLEVGAEVWAKITTGPNPLCKQMCGCGGYIKINRLLGPETCQKKLPIPGGKGCEQTACGCGPGCPALPPFDGPFCEDYLPGPVPANCVNGPNWPGQRPNLPNLLGN